MVLRNQKKKSIRRGETIKAAVRAIRIDSWGRAMEVEARWWGKEEKREVVSLSP